MYDSNDTTKHRPADHPPENAAHFVVYHKGLTDNSSDESTIYEPGDELPADLAESVWSAFGDRIAAFDAHGHRLDEPVRGDVDKDTSALAPWKSSAPGTPGTADTPQPADPFICEMCGKAFAKKSAYHGHQATHTDTAGDPPAPDVSSGVATEGGERA